MNEQQKPSKDKEIAKDPVPFPDEVIHLEVTMQKLDTALKMSAGLTRNTGIPKGIWRNTEGKSTLMKCFKTNCFSGRQTVQVPLP